MEFFFFNFRKLKFGEFVKLQIKLVLPNWGKTLRLQFRNKTCSPFLHSLVKTEANVWENSRADQVAAAGRL